MEDKMRKYIAPGITVKRVIVWLVVLLPVAVFAPGLLILLIMLAAVDIIIRVRRTKREEG